MHGGVIGVKSEGEGYGTTFSFELPLFEKVAVDYGSMESAKQINLTKPELEDGSFDSLTQSPTPIRTHSLRHSKSAAVSFAQAGPTTSRDIDIESDTQLLNGQQYDPHLYPSSWSIQGTSYKANGMFSTSLIPFKGAQIYDVEKENDSAGRAVLQSEIKPPENRSHITVVEDFVECDESKSSKTEELKKVLRPLRVLIVDDTASSRKITAKVLMNLGYVVEEASDGVEFLLKLGIKKPNNDKTDKSRGATLDPFAASQSLVAESLNKDFDVILMDDNMPNMCGPDATAAARAAGYTGLIFGLTGNTYDAQLEHFVGSGADKVFSKPLNIEKLQETIRDRITEASKVKI